MFIDDDAVRDFKSCCGCDFGVRDDADADHHQVGRQDRPIRQVYAIHLLLLAETRKAGLEPELDAVFAARIRIKAVAAWMT